MSLDGFWNQPPTEDVDLQGGSGQSFRCFSRVSGEWKKARRQTPGKGGSAPVLPNNRRPRGQEERAVRPKKGGRGVSFWWQSMGRKEKGTLNEYLLCARCLRCVILLEPKKKKKVYFTGKKLRLREVKELEQFKKNKSQKVYMYTYIYLIYIPRT